MTPTDVKNFFGNGYLFRKKTGMSSMSFSNWMKWGFVPVLSQIKLHKLTKGALKAEIEDITE